LSYALAGDSAQAESTLRAAVDLPNADARVRQNLVLVLGVQGKFAEAEKAAGPETPKALLDSNTAYFRALLTPARSWDNLRGTQN
jgi:Flp pilus assembly protein TadD